MSGVDWNLAKGPPFNRYTAKSPDAGRSSVYTTSHVDSTDDDDAIRLVCGGGVGGEVRRCGGNMKDPPGGWESLPR